MNKKVAIHTEALGSIHSGGIRCIVYFLNFLKKRGYDVTAFVDVPPYNSTWLESSFDVLPSTHRDYFQYDGTLISPYSPTARRVSEHKNASKRIYWCHTFEGNFKHNGPQWRKQAIDSYKLKNIHYMATSHYVKTFLELIFEQKVMPHLVPGGVDQEVFKRDEKLYEDKQKSNKCIFCMLNRPEPLRGIQIGLAAFEILKKDFGDRVELKLFAGLPQNEMYKSYGAAHYFLDPSLLAGLPLPPLEAMACGTIPIVTHYGTTDYIIDGQNGFFINTNDIEDTYRVIKRATEMYFRSFDIKKDANYEHTQYEMVSTLAIIHAKEWTWEKMVDNFEKNIESLEK